MTRVKISLVILLMIIMLCVSSLLWIDFKLDKVSEFLEETITFSRNGETEKAVESSKKMVKEWESFHDIGGVLIRSDKITSVQTSMSRITPLVRKNHDELEAEYENAKQGLEWIFESELPLLKNIL